MITSLLIVTSGVPHKQPRAHCFLNLIKCQATFCVCTDLQMPANIIDKNIPLLQGDALKLEKLGRYLHLMWVATKYMLNITYIS